MFEWLSGLALGLPLLVIVYIFGLSLPRFVSWTIFIVLAIIWASFLPLLADGAGVIRGFIGV